MNLIGLIGKPQRPKILPVHWKGTITYHDIKGLQGSKLTTNWSHMRLDFCFVPKKSCVVTPPHLKSQSTVRLLWCWPYQCTPSGKYKFKLDIGCNTTRQQNNNKVAPFSFHRCVYYSSFLNPISQWILWTQTFISSHVVMAVIVLGAPSSKRGDWGWD